MVQYQRKSQVPILEPFRNPNANICKITLQTQTPTHDPLTTIPFLSLPFSPPPQPLASKIVYTISSPPSILTTLYVARRIIPHRTSIPQDRWSNSINVCLDDADIGEFATKYDPDALTDGDFVVEADHLVVTTTHVSLCKLENQVGTLNIEERRYRGL